MSEYDSENPLDNPTVAYEPLNPYQEDSIDKKILAAKLEVTEKRLGYAITILTLLLLALGVVLPIYQVNKASERVDASIEKLENKFKELTEAQNIKSNLICTFQGKIFKNSIISIKKNQEIVFWVNNHGNGVAQWAKFTLFIENTMARNNYVLNPDWYKMSHSELEGFDQYLFDPEGGRMYSVALVTKDQNVSVPLKFTNFPPNFKNVKALLRIADPFNVYNIPFTFNIE